MHLRSTSMILAALIASANLFSVATWEAFVPHSDNNTLIPISVPSDIVGTPIPVGDPFYPNAVAITPDGGRAIVVGGYTNDVAVIDLTQPSPEPVPIDVGTSTNSVAITPDGRWALALSNSAGSVAVLDLSQSPVALASTIIVAADPRCVVITPDGTRALVCSGDGHGIDVLTIGEIVEYGYFVSLGDSLTDIAVSPDGREALVSSRLSQKVYVLDLTQPYISGASYTISVEGTWTCLNISPNGAFALVVCDEGLVNVLDMTQSTIVRSYIISTSQSTLVSVAFSPDSTRAYVVSRHGTVSVFDMTQVPIALVDTIEVAAGGLQYIAITPDQAPTSSFTISADGLTVSCDATTSSSPIGGIREYLWDFGDGTDPVSTTSPTTAHIYEKSGTYTITLTVVNDGGTSTAITFTGQTVSNHGLPRAQSIQTITLDPQAPAAFTGEARLSENGNEIFLKVRWPSSTDMDTLKYEIFARGTKIAEFFPTIHNHATIKLNPHHIPDLISPDYKLYLHHKYGIRSINTEGLASSIVWLEVE